MITHFTATFIHNGSRFATDTNGLTWRLEPMPGTNVMSWQRFLAYDHPRYTPSTSAPGSEAEALNRLAVVEDLLRQANGDVAALERRLVEARAEVDFEWEPEEG